MRKSLMFYVFLSFVLSFTFLQAEDGSDYQTSGGYYEGLKGEKLSDPNSTSGGFIAGSIDGFNAGYTGKEVSKYVLTLQKKACLLNGEESYVRSYLQKYQVGKTFHDEVGDTPEASYQKGYRKGYDEGIKGKQTMPDLMDQVSLPGNVNAYNRGYRLGWQKGQEDSEKK